LNRTIFLTLASGIAVVVGVFALAAPSVLLASKGITSAAAGVWVREVGVLLVAVGISVFMVRHHADSPTLRALLIGNLVVQLGLLPLEVLAYREGIITVLAGIVPNTLIHGLLAGGFGYYAWAMRRSPTA
jgi:hypothetical protein